ncbi:D-alanyl-D-alanine carboxypeptidase [Erythrobacter litoralis HTCC2594]|uniref:serine-type D-Ala-D-Ala carboxypeptidase n=2 Tax=Erythrobacter litoralis TaxID=39960 RepID=Q2NAF7_ERYLH|nr:D-alanyl-D-alanine carboxypeptidase [Erythrobacter litoralis HTCC2594]
MLVDMASGQTLYARNPDRRFVPASITKVMTAYTAFELMKQGKLAPGTRFTFSEAAADEWYRTGSTMFLDRGSETAVTDLLMGITTVSANDGSIVLAEGAAGSVDNWLDLMNAHADALGMHQSHFGTPNGWPDEGRTFTTARDLVTLAKALITEHPGLYARYFGHRGLRTNGIAQDNYDPITGRIEGADGIKTGFTNQAGWGFLGSAERDGRRLVMVVAASPGMRSRDETARALMEWGFGAFDSRMLFRSGDTVGHARVQDGAEAAVPLMADRDIPVALPENANAEITLRIAYEGPLRAPVEQGEKVAQLAIFVDGREAARVPLAAKKAVAKAGPLQRIANAVRALWT